MPVPRLPLLLLLGGCASPLDPLVQTHTLQAEAVDQVFTIRTLVPPDAEGPLPLVLLFDGDDWTGTTTGILARLLDEGVIDPPLLVSVGYGDTPNARGRDLTPPGEGVPEGHGGIAPFFAFLGDELLPWVDDRFPTRATPDSRTLLGHSFGGLAAAWGLFEARDHFANAIALSPSLVFADGLLFAREAAWAETHDDLPARVHLGAGTLEDHALAGLTEAFGARLAARDHPGLALQVQLEPGLAHADLFPVGAEAGLRFVLGAP